MLRAIGLSLVLAASSVEAAPPALPPHYANMFVLGMTWTYAVSSTTWAASLEHVDTQKVPSSRWPKHTFHDVVTCKVVEVATYADAIVSRITCDKDGDELFEDIFKSKFDVGGIYVATASGLHDFIELPQPDEDFRNLENPLIAAKPRASVKKTTDEDSGVMTETVRMIAGEWCASTTFVGTPHTGVITRCFGRGGFVSGRHDVGGDYHDVQYRAR